MIRGIVGIVAKVGKTANEIESVIEASAVIGSAARDAVRSTTGRTGNDPAVKDPETVELYRRAISMPLLKVTTMMIRFRISPPGIIDEDTRRISHMYLTRL